MNQQAPPAVASFAEFARLANVKRSYVTELKASGRLVLSEDGKAVRVAESLERIAATRDPAKAAVAARHAAHRAITDKEQGRAATAHENAPAAPADVQDDPIVASTYQTARAEREKYLAMEAKRAYEQAIGKLLDAAHVEAALADAITTLRTQLEGLPDILSSDVAAEADEARCRALIADAVEQMLTELSQQFRRVTQTQQEAAA